MPAQQIRNQTAGRGFKKCQRGEGDDASEAAADVERVSENPVRIGVKRPPHITWPRPTNISATSTKKTAAIASIGRTKFATSGLPYSVPKKTSCAERWLPTSMTRPLQKW